MLHFCNFYKKNLPMKIRQVSMKQSTRLVHLVTTCCRNAKTRNNDCETRKWMPPPCHSSYIHEIMYVVFIVYDLGQCTSLLLAKRKEFLHPITILRRTEKRCILFLLIRICVSITYLISLYLYDIIRKKQWKCDYESWQKVWCYLIIARDS